MTKDTLLKQIPEIRLLEKNGQSYLETPDKSKHGLNKCIDMCSQDFGKEILKRETLTKEELESIKLLLIQKTLNQFKDSNLLVTEDNLLLSHRAEFQRIFSTPLNIVSMEEAAEFIDLTFKYNSQFLISPHVSTSKEAWYFYSFRIKVPHYNVDFPKKLTNLTIKEMSNNTMMDGFSQRASFLLMAIDEIGFQHFSGVNNTTQEGMLYHFNYFILLMTGIYDSLALQTMDKYKLTFEGSHIPSRISLNPDNGKEFLKALKAENLPLRLHIQNNCDLIKTPYLLRESIVHREGLRAIHVDDNGWKVNLISVPQEFVECLKRLGDEKRKYIQITDYGMYSNFLLEPYTFSKKIARLLFVFCDKYLELMGYPNFLEQQPIDKSLFSFSDTVTRFKDGNLGF